MLGFRSYFADILQIFYSFLTGYNCSFNWTPFIVQPFNKNECYRAEVFDHSCIKTRLPEIPLKKIL